MYTTEPRRRQVPPCRSTCSIRNIWRKRTPLNTNNIQASELSAEAHKYYHYPNHSCIDKVNVPEVHKFQVKPHTIIQVRKSPTVHGYTSEWKNYA
jgi:hypothetical protein